MSGEPLQVYAKQVTDGLGRVVETWRSLPDDKRAVQLIRYDSLGRVVFQSEWIDEETWLSTALTKVSWWYVHEVPIHPTNGVPWGTVFYYGTPDPDYQHDPIRATPDGLGRLLRIENLAGDVTTISYCGPHKTVTTERVQTDFGVTEPSSTTYYYDGLGRLVLVDAPADTADAEYSYDPRGNLTRVNLVSELPTDPFGAWRSGDIPLGQVRNFTYDAAGRLKESSNPESGKTVIHAYDPAGNILVWQDQLGLQRDYFFRNEYDAAGRLTKVERIQGNPDSPASSDRDLIGGAGDFDESSDVASQGSIPGVWVEGSIADGVFYPGGAYWRQIEYQSQFCINTPPGEPGNEGMLYLGNPGGCSYGDSPPGAQAVRFQLDDVDREDGLSFMFWRQVRQAVDPKDRFFAVVVPQVEGDSVENARQLFELNAIQASFAQWRQTQHMRLGDLFSASEWPEPGIGSSSTKDLFLYIVFEKGDSSQSGLGRGIAIDDVFVGRRRVEAVAEYEYDTDHCAAGAAIDECEGESANLYLGKLSGVSSYHDGRMVSEERFVYRGLNGRLSGRQLDVDWAGVGEFITFVNRYSHRPDGLLGGGELPYQPGYDSTRDYVATYDRGHLAGLASGSRSFLAPGSGAIDYSASGVPTAIRFGNGTVQDFELDELNRLSQTLVRDSEQASLWDSGAYEYDGMGHVTQISGSQAFIYDLVGQLKAASVLPQASDPIQTTPSQIDYTHDTLGNVTVRTQSAGTAAAGMEFTHSYPADLTANKNQIESLGFAYDPNGNMTRTITGDLESSATWYSTGELSAFVHGQPESGFHRVAERYAYDAGGARLIKYPESDLGDGRPIITIRNLTGEVLSEYVVDPATGSTGLNRDYVYAGGQLVAERIVVESAPQLRASDVLEVAGDYYFVVTDLSGAGSVTVDIRTSSGFVNRLYNVVPDSAGMFFIPETEFSLDEVNYIRVKGETTEPSAYSAPVTLAIRSSVTETTPNLTRAVSVSRVDTDVIVSFDVFNDEERETRIQFKHGDSNYRDTLATLAPGVTTYVVAEQSLAVSCGSIYTHQEAGRPWGAELSIMVDVPSYDPVQDIESAGASCDGPAELGTYLFAESFHHRDHLGSLRVATDAAGFKVSAHDYYPFGIEMFDPVAGPQGSSNMRYTVHERDSLTDVDYMMARYKSASSATFMSPDQVHDVSLGRPASWNKYTYTRNNPINYIDPTGNSCWGTNATFCFDIPPGWGGQPGDGSYWDGSFPGIGPGLDPGWVTYEPPRPAPPSWKDQARSRGYRGTGTGKSGQFDQFPYDFGTTWLERLFAVQYVTRQWMAGRQSDLYIDGGPFADVLRDADVVNQARQFWYEQVRTGKKGIGDPLTNFRGQGRLRGNFSVTGIGRARFEPVLQFLGSFSVEISSNGSALTFTVWNDTGLDSFFHGWMPNDSLGPYGATVSQRITFTEPINFGLIAP